MSSAADAMFVSPVYLVKNSTLLIVEGARIELASGGLCGPTTTIYAIGELDLSGGQTAMRSSCSIVGRGKLHVTGGRHGEFQLVSLLCFHVFIADAAIVSLISMLFQ
jgi:hypothetical protein